MIPQLVNGMIGLMLARFMLNDVPHYLFEETTMRELKVTRVDERGATGPQLRYIAILSMRLKIPEPVVKGFGEAGRMIRELEAEEKYRKTKKLHPPKPVARVVIVPGGSRWQCLECGRMLEAGEEAVKIGAKVYCVECTRGGNPDELSTLSGFTEEEIKDIKDIAEYLKNFYADWEGREYSYEEILQQAKDEFLRRKRVREWTR